MIRFPAELLAECPAWARPLGEIPKGGLTGLAVDSRQVQPGMLFVAVAGSREDGRIHIRDALERGAVGVLHDDGQPFPQLPAGVFRWHHPRPRQALAWLAAAWHGHPGRRMRVVAVTGTNGKTSTAGMMAAIMTAAGEPCGVIGTTGIHWPGGARPNPMTTPDPLTLQEILAEMAKAGCQAVAMEASSHALDQYRVDGVPFAAGIFTNLTRDHLDYHGGMDAYFRAKARLFLELTLGVGAINREDPWGRALEERCLREGLAVRGFQSRPAQGVVAAQGVTHGWDGTRFHLWPGSEATTEVHLPVAGDFNLMNALGAATAALGMGVDRETVARGLNQFTPVKGRMETLRQGQPFAVVVDYAHTPDALERLLQAARGLTPGKVWVMFGCGGDRDAGKRPIMGGLAARLADGVIVTDDNPRSEDPAAIRAAILKGMSGHSTPVREVPDRAAAIAAALKGAQPGDAVLLAGKGHETVQIIGHQRHPFDDGDVARAQLKTMGYGDA